MSAYLKKLPPQPKSIRRVERKFPKNPRFKKRILPRKLRIIIYSILIVSLILFIFVGFPLLSFYSSAKAMKRETFQISQHLEALDFEAIQKDLKSMDKELTKLEGKANRYSYLQIIPGTSAFFEDAPI